MPLGMKTWMFDVVALEDGELAAMDGGTHGVSGHIVRILRDGSARWERSVDSMGDDVDVGSGALALAAEDRPRLLAWADAVWTLGDPRKPWPPPAPDPDPAVVNGPPPWVWAVLVRRGEAIRAVQGDTWTGAPDELAPLLAWMVERVDAACRRVAR